MSRRQGLIEDLTEQIADVIERLRGKIFCEASLPDPADREEFIATWLDMRYPPGIHSLDLAFADVAESPIKPGTGSSGIVYEKLQGLVTIFSAALEIAIFGCRRSC